VSRPAPRLSSGLGKRTVHRGLAPPVRACHARPEASAIGWLLWAVGAGILRVSMSRSFRRQASAAASRPVHQPRALRCRLGTRGFRRVGCMRVSASRRLPFSHRCSEICDSPDGRPANRSSTAMSSSRSGQ